MPADIGQGSYITFGTILGSGSGSAATGQYKVTSISWSGIERAVVDASHMLTTGGKEFVASELYDPGEITAEILFDPSVKPWTAITSVDTAQAVAVYFADGGANVAAWSAKGYLTAFEAGSQMEDMQTGTITIKVSGSIS